MNIVGLCFINKRKFLSITDDLNITFLAKEALVTILGFCDSYPQVTLGTGKFF